MRFGTRDEALVHPGCQKVSECVEEGTIPPEAGLVQLFPQKKIPRAKSPKDCTLVHLILQRFIGYLSHRFPKTTSGRFSGSRIILLSAPSHLALAKQWL